jgi:hypothetical protein
MINCKLYHRPDPFQCRVEDKNSGKSIVINCRPETFVAALREYQSGKLMQEAFHFLTAEEREFLISGMTPEEWKELFGDG